MEMLATCRIQRPVSLEFGASGECGGGVGLCGGRVVVDDRNLVEPLVSIRAYSGPVFLPSSLVSHVRSPRLFPVGIKIKTKIYLFIHFIPFLELWTCAQHKCSCHHSLCAV